MQLIIIKVNDTGEITFQAYWSVLPLGCGDITLLPLGYGDITLNIYGMKSLTSCLHFPQHV